MAGMPDGKSQTMMVRSVLLIIILVLLALTSKGQAKGRRVCGTHIEDWCRSYQGDPCNRHKYTAACKADPKCHGMHYLGNSFVPCFLDERGFASNCPAVGCTSREPKR
jgi:hypothetical protein